MNTEPGIALPEPESQGSHTPPSAGAFDKGEALLLGSEGEKKKDTLHHRGEERVLTREQLIPVSR